MPCLVCGHDSHIPEECPIPGTSLVGRVALPDMVDACLDKYQNRGQCHICKAYHLPGGKYGKCSYTSKQCLHSLLAKGSLWWDMEASLLEWSKDHCQILHIPELKRQRGLDGRPDQQWTIKALDKVFTQLKDQRSVPMVF